MPIKYFTEFTYLGLSDEQQQEISTNLKAGLKIKKPAPDILDETPEITAQQREIAKIKAKAGLKKVVNKYKENKSYNDEYIDQKLAGRAIVVCVQGQVMKAGEPVWIRSETPVFIKLRGLINCTEMQGKDPLYTEGPTIEANSAKEAAEKHLLQASAEKRLFQASMEVEKKKKQESKK